MTRSDFLDFNGWLGLGAFTQAGCAGLYASHLFEAERADLGRCLLYMMLLLFGTVSLYGTHRIISLGLISSNELEARWIEISRYRGLIFKTTVICSAISLIIYCLLPYDWQWRILLPASLAALYVLPVFGGYRLRDLGPLKIWVLSLGWVGLTFWVPMSAMGGDARILPDLSDSIIWFVLTERLLFMLGHSLAFDYRDLSVDRKAGVRTIPSYLSRNATRNISLSLISVSIVLLYTSAAGDGTLLSPTPYLACTSVISLPLMYKAFSADVDYTFYTFWIDGLFVLPAILLIAALGLLTVLAPIFDSFY